MCIWLVNQAQGLADLIAPQNDHASLEQEVAITRTCHMSLVKITTKEVETRAASDGKKAQLHQLFNVLTA